MSNIIENENPALLSDWLLQDIDEEAVLNTSDDTDVDLTLPMVTAYYSIGIYGVYSNYYNTYTKLYGNYSNYYYNYSNYYNYYNYSNYSNSISIVTNPTSQAITYGSSVTFTVTASNTIDSCQWYKSKVSSGSGTAISGATSASYTFTPTRADDGTYYYVIVKRGSNSATSTSALLTVKYLSVGSAAARVGGTCTIVADMTPASSTISSCTSESTSIATVTNSGIITGVAEGSTVITVTSSNGLSRNIPVYVIANEVPHTLDATFTCLANAIRSYRDLSTLLYPNQLANALANSSSASRSYTTMDGLFTDLATELRALNGSTSTYTPEQMYFAIYSLPKYSINVTAINCTVNGGLSYYTTITPDQTRSLTLGTASTYYKLPTSITIGSTTVPVGTSTVVPGMATFLYTRTSDSAGTLAISNPIDNITFTVTGLLPQLETPTNLTADGTTIEFDAVENAEEYEVFADGVSIGEYTPGPSEYTVTLTASGDWSHESYSKVKIYEGEDDTGTLIFDEEPSSQSHFPTTIQVHSNKIYIDLYVSYIMGVDVTSTDFVIDPVATATYIATIDKDGSIDLGVTDWDD